MIAHEVGHYFSLNHTFEGGCPNGNCLTNGDLVCDTPPKATPGLTGTCANPGNSCITDEDDTSMSNPYRSVALGGMGDQPDMLANYLDYTGSCWDSYTQGQKVRMRSSIDAYREEIKNNIAACNAQPAPGNDAGVTSIILPPPGPCSGAFTPQVTFKNYGSSTLTSANIIARIDDVVVYTEPWTGGLAPNGSATITLANPLTVSVGSHIVAISTQSPNSGSDANIYNDADYRSIAYTAAHLINPLNGATNIPVTSALTWAATAGATGYKLKGGTTPGGTDILNNFDVGNVTVYNPPGNFPYNTTIYVKITPYNANGDAMGCPEESFVTEMDPAVLPTLVSLTSTTIRIKYHNPIAPATATAANLPIWGDETGLRAGTYTVSLDTVTFVATTLFGSGN
ncbi:MAG: hypothetical protein IPM98_06075 [Lewinellaceae bacterium]|nr:hypothetical protein [Lewinellaceae bacterium]